MSDSPNANTNATLEKLLGDHGLNRETRMFREAVRDSLQPTATPGVFRLTANTSPGEAIVDVYGQGYVVQAEDVGPGLAFAESTAPNWQETMEMRTLKSKSVVTPQALPDRVEVEVRLADILEQGGLVYPVESVTVERAWYCTLPAGGIEVREIPR